MHFQWLDRTQNVVEDVSYILLVCNEQTTICHTLLYLLAQAGNLLLFTYSAPCRCDEFRLRSCRLNLIAQFRLFSYGP